MSLRQRGTLVACLSTLAAVAVGAGEPAAARQRIDARFVADRVLVGLRMPDGRVIGFYTDTGGGGVLVWADAARRLGLATRAPEATPADGRPEGSLELATPLTVTGGPALPAKVPVTPDFIVALGGPAEADGFLGAPWFAGRTWTWDYPAGTLTLEDDDWRPVRGAALAKVTFRRDAGADAAPPFPRIVVRIAGEDTSVLLDTGAETLLKPAALAKLGGGPALRATSMITASRLSAWRTAHPDWLVIEDAQVRTGARMIRVPDVVIAGIQVGPVWFTERPDANFHGMMSSMMDAPVEGAIGGNAFRNLRMTVDYRGGRATFERR